MKVRVRRAGLALIGVALVLMAVAIPAYRSAMAGPGERTVTITIHFSRFSPDSIDVRPGETIRFVVQNTDPIDHEFILGDASVQRFFEKGTEALHVPSSGVMGVPAGTTQVTTYTFAATAGSLLFGCHLPGHYAYGMRGIVTIA